MTTINNITEKIVQQCQNLFLELSNNDGNFIYSKNLTTQTPIIASISQSPSLIVFNNSFLFRDKSKIKTTKSPYCLAIKSFPPVDEPNIVVAEYSLNRDWDFIHPKAKTYPVYNNLRESILSQLNNLGEIIYILIGKVGFPQVISETINSSPFSEVVFDSNIHDLHILGDQIIANPNINDIEIWHLFKQKTSLSDTEVEKLRSRFFETLEKLRKNLLCPLVIPTKGSDLEETFFDEILIALEDEIRSYESSLKAWIEKSDENINFNNILRISYNFVDDIEKLLRLIVNISDLKPILFWMTIHSQYVLKSEFSKLDWQKTNKPSIPEYSRLIKGARNSRFHNMMNMKNTIEVDMNRISIQAKRLVFFNEYSNKGKNNFEFKDQQLIDVLIEFNRAAEKSVSDSFWTQNLAIMNAAYNLVFDFTDSLKLLRLLG